MIAMYKYRKGDCPCKSGIDLYRMRSSIIEVPWHRGILTIESERTSFRTY